MVTIKGIEFDFSPMNAAHLERVQTATERYNAALRELRGKKIATVQDRIAEIRSTCGLFRDYVDGVLGAGASDLLEISADDAEQAYEGLQMVVAAITQAKKDIDDRYSTVKLV